MDLALQRSRDAVRRRVESALVAKVGTIVFALVLGIPMVLPASGAQAAVMVADVTTVRDVAPTLHAVDPGHVDLVALRALVVAREAVGAASVEDPATPPPPALAPVAPAAPPPLPAPAALVITDGTVLASWYGPGFYGNRTACGHTYTPEILGVAHRTLPCGTLVRITSSAGLTVVVPVIDRGPYVYSRELDLSNATRLALHCGDLCRVRVAVP